MMDILKLTYFWALGWAVFLPTVSTVTKYPAYAQSRVHSSASNLTVQFIPPPIASYDISGLADRGAPEGREAAGTRGVCLPQTADGMTPSSSTESIALTALTPTVAVPYGHEMVQTPMGSTAQAYPTFFFYMPHTQEDVEAIQFTLLDADESPVASVDVPVPQKAGLLQVTWPSEQPPLSVDTDYRWLLQVDCHDLPPSSATQPITAQTYDEFTTDWVVQGFIRRFAEAELKDEASADSETTTAIDAVSQLATAGLWNDALHALLSKQDGDPQPDTISIALEQLLVSVGLDGMASHLEIDRD